MARALEEQQQTDIHEEHPAVGPDGEKLDDESVAGESHSPQHCWQRN